MGRLWLMGIALLVCSSCVGATEPIDCVVMAGLLGLRTLAERAVRY